MVEKTPHDPDFEGLLRHIQESRGVDFRGYKRTSLRRRVGIRMEAVGAEDFLSYRSHLEAQPSEYEELLNTVLINVTSFFRDEEAWQSLRQQVIPAIVKQALDERPIRVWSAGCASGEEPYSIAILLAEQMGIADFCRRVKIYATDLDEDALKAARRATYSPHDVANVPPEMLEKYFERINNHYAVERELRKCVIFGRHNVVNDPPISRIDLLCCRNLLIYLEPETQAVVLPRLHYALNRDGYLFLGKAETQLARSSMFSPVEMKHRLFAKVPAEWRRPVGSAFTPARAARLDTILPYQYLLEEALNEVGAAIIVVDEQGDVSLANVPARRLLGVGQADVGRPFQDLPVSYRPIELRGSIDESFSTRRIIRLEEQEFQLNRTEMMRLTIEVRPLVRPDGSVQAVLLAFHDHTRIHALQRELEAVQEKLEQSTEELQSANEELETTNEELQSTNDELETTNEELQSTNEELETLNEEARTSNDEMEWVNEELRIQAKQASSYRIHLESVMRAMNGGIIVLDQRHIIQSWNRWSENTWGLRTEEVIGNSFEAVDIGVPIQTLRESMADVLSGRKEQVERTIEGIDRCGRRIICRIRMSGIHDDDRQIRGIVLVFQDVTEEREKEDTIRYLGRIMRHALNEIYFLDPISLRFRLTNEGAERELGFTAAELDQMALPDLLPGIETSDLRALLAPLLTGQEEEFLLRSVMRSSEGTEHPVQMCFQYLGDEAPPIIVVIVQRTEDVKLISAAS